MITASSFVLLFAAFASCCQREHVKRGGTHTHRHHGLEKRQTEPLSSEESTLVNSFDNNTIAQWNYYYTHGYHLAGTNRTMAQWTADRFAENGFTSGLIQYDTYLNYPVSHSLSLTYPNGSVFELSLDEQQLEEDETTTYPNRVPTFNGYSATGNASAEYVYVGRGQQVDFKRLQALGVPLEGKIALAKYGGPFRGLKVKNAQEYGMVGVVLFTDPGDDGNVTEANGYAAYPDGPARNPTSVQRGSVQFLSTYPGDPTTPGYPSKEGVPRADKSPVVPHIPSLPISYQEAIPLLAALDGHGTEGKAVNRTGWVGALNVTYSTGPAPGATLSLSNVMRDAITPIWDAIGVINGTSEDEVLLIGNHRDAWIIGGAADPNSGTAILVELSKAFGKLLATGWKPRRTIVLASWDAEEYGLVGSTEWVEEYVNWLTESAVSYLNIDVGVSGPRPELSATPELHSIAIETMKKTIWPLVDNQTFYDAWLDENDGEAYVLGSGSDYTSFLHKGIGSLDVGAGNGPNDPVYHYHSDYDSYHWMSTFGDPGYQYHKAMGQYLTLLAYHIADDEIIPFNASTYTDQLRLYYSDLQDTLASYDATLDTSALTAAIDTFDQSAQDVTTLKNQAISTNDADLKTLVNHKLRDFQRGFTSQGGLPNREFFKHVAFAPGIDTGYAPVTYPGITEAVEAGDLALAQQWVVKTAQGIERAAGILRT
ncbi:MAG: hypothetical protein M1820_010612 [Bogoriella megaspora]|nr:MAG: hypothetical protein M1820_010612 [Bogoriella megaspora]